MKREGVAYRNAPPDHLPAPALGSALFPASSMLRRNTDVFFPVETGSLKTVYLLALAALDSMHVVDENVMGRLADAVFESYLDTRSPHLPLSSTQAED